MPRLGLFICALLSFFSCQGQKVDRPSLERSKPDTLFTFSMEIDSSKLHVVDTAELKIYNSNGLSSFFKKLHQLEHGQRKKIRIAHIGDSHIQAGFVTRRMRGYFQTDFGNGGRGLLFPYKQARTNGPADYKIRSNISWDTKRNVHPNKPMDIGVAGITVGAKDSIYYLQFQMEASDRFDTLCIFQNGPDANPYTCFSTKDNRWLDQYLTIKEEKKHKIKSGETLSGIAAKYRVSVNDLRRWNNLRGDNIYAGKTLIIQQKQRVSKIPNEQTLQSFDGQSTYDTGRYNIKFSKATDHAIIKYQGSKGNEINGIYIENPDTGVVYSMIGVNGAKYEHYNKSEHFQNQLKQINCDLIIIALGTNESLDITYDSLRLEQQVAQFVDTMQHYNPDAALLICLNPDAYRRKRKNPNAQRIHDILRDICERRHLAYFDPYAIMGGSGGMYKWKKAEIASHDLIHFTVNGYHFWGDLFYYSLMKSYARNRSILAAD